MSRRRKLSFTDQRRASLAMKCRLEKLESKQTITEPICGCRVLSVSAIQGVWRSSGVMQADGGNGASLGLALAAQQAKASD